MKDRILITGVAGFIGFHLAKSLLDSGLNICGVDEVNDYYDIKLKNDRLNILKKYSKFRFNKLDISNLSELREAFLDFKPNVVFSKVRGMRAISIIFASIVAFCKLEIMCKASNLI